MEYVEILRARRILTWYTAILIAGLVITAISFYAGHGHNDNHGNAAVRACWRRARRSARSSSPRSSLPGLSAEAANTTALIWTRPAPRDEVAARFVGIDVAAILIGYVILLVTMLAGVAILGALPIVTFDSAAVLRSASLGLGAAVMWYAVISAAASRLPGRGALHRRVGVGRVPDPRGAVSREQLPHLAARRDLRAQLLEPDGVAGRHDAARQLVGHPAQRVGARTR